MPLPLPLATAAAVGAASALALAAAPAQAADGSFACSATGPGVAVLGRPVLPTATAGAPDGPCAPATAGIGDLLQDAPLVDVDALAASTDLTGGPDVRAHVASASGGVLSAQVGGLGSLGLPLDEVTDSIVLPPGLEQVRVALPAPLTSALTPIISLARVLNPTLAASLSDLVTNGLTFDTGQLVRDAVALPQTDLLDASAITATATARCVDGALVLDGAHAVAPVRVLGQVVDADTPATQLLPVTGTTVDLTKLDLTQIELPSFLTGLGLEPLLGGVLSTVQESVVRQLQAALPAGGLALPADLVRLDVTPGGQDRTATSLTERALRLRVAVAGREVADLRGGSATVRAQDVDCAEPAPPALPDPPADTTPEPAPEVPAATTEQAPPPTPTVTTTTAPAVTQPAPTVVRPTVTTFSGTAPSLSAPPTAAAAPTAAQQLLQCSERRLVLTNVLQRPNRVALFGVADRALAGRTVTIRFRASGQDVATATVAPDGTFQTTAPLPSRALRGTNAARYQARIGALTSLDLKLQRRMVVQRIDQADGQVTVRGHVAGPFPSGGATVLLTRRVSCRTSEPVARVRADAHGDFAVTVDAPTGQSAVVYRLQSKVRTTTRSARTSRTYTLPQGVDIAR